MSCCCRAVLLTDVCLQDGFRQKMKRRLFDSKTVLMPSAEQRREETESECRMNEGLTSHISRFFLLSKCNLSAEQFP